MKTITFLFSAAIFAMGCVDSTPSLNDSNDNIVGGVVTQGDPAVVALVASSGSLCTGSIIAPDVVLTAAHCVIPDLVGQDATFSVFLGHDINNPETRGTEVEVEEVHFDPQFDLNNLGGGHDIAVAILKTPVDIEPLPFRRAPLTADLVGDPVRIVGYGLNNGFAQTGAGVKRTAGVNLNSFNAQFVRSGVTGENICSGDSGGPVLLNVDGEETIIGVNSFGFIFCLFESSSTRVDANLDFIDQFLQ